MPQGKRKRTPHRLGEQEQRALAWSASDVRPALAPAAEEQLAAIVESYAQEEEAQVEKELQQTSRRRKKAVKPPPLPKLRVGTPAIHLCTFVHLALLDSAPALDSTKTLRIRIETVEGAPIWLNSAATAVGTRAYLATEGHDGVRVAEAPAELENDRQTCRALAALTNAGLASLLPVVEEEPRRLSVRVLLNQEALEEEASFGDASERPANVELRLALALAMSVRGDASFVPYTPQRTRVAARSAMSADAVQKIFAAAAPARDAPALATAPEGLLLSLRRYQLQAVQWMCDREASVAALADPLWEPLADASAPGQSFLYNRCIGRVKRAQPVSLLKDIAGGILADEMGLGKTLEVIALLLARPSPLPRPAPPRFEAHVACACGVTSDDGQPMVQCDECQRWQHCACVVYEPSAKFYCNKCVGFVSEAPAPARGTLIICPASILAQWCEEIRKHTAPGALQVVVYKSVRDKGRLTHPRKLQAADVVLATYETLRADLSHVQDGHRGREFRNKRRYPPLPTPLTHIKWHRIVLDECQLVEGHTAAAEMARQLHATHRWAVSGTPIGTSLDDLFGLFAFLHVEPYGERVWWQRGLATPFECGREAPLMDVIRRLMWRNTKAAVVDQLGLPPQHEQISTLRFKEVEAYWYKKQYDDACFRANEMLALLDKRGSLSSKPRANLLLPLLQLRQACCHPQVGAHGIRSLKKNPMTMGELLDALIQKAKIEALEAQRALLCAINGLAALALCQHDADKAIEIYRECMMVMEANKGDLPPDRLQRIHTLHNMSFAVEQQARSKGAGDSGGVALQQRRMKEEEEALQQEYVRDRLNRVVSQHAKTEALTQEATAALGRFSLEWLLTALTKAKEDQAALLTSLIKDTLDHGGRVGVVGKRRLPAWRNLPGLQLLLVKEVDELLQARREFMGALATLSTIMTPAEVAEASQCSRCRRKKGPLCRHCAALPLLEAYQQRLYTVLRQAEEKEEELLALGEEDVVRRRPELLIQRTPSEAETVIKLVQGFAQHHMKEALGPKLLTEAEESLAALQLLKKELDAAQVLWRHRVDYAAALDEVDMCQMRISVVPDRERVPENERHYRIYAAEIPAMQVKLNADKIRASNELSHAQRQLAYLRNLTPQATASAECPVCHEQVGQRRVLLPCGHVFCSDCTVSLMRHSHSLTTVKCPSCREIINKEEVSYVQDDAPPVPEAMPSVRGSYGTKIETIVATLLGLTRADPLSKSIVFSEWTDVLRIVANALDENNIPYLEIKAKKDFDHTIGTFKQSPAIRVLLMTTKQGANGLNLIEATNVLLVEPLLNPAVENQAINRVHRIGQTHETRVFRFIVNSTVEERIFAYNRRRSAASASALEVNLKRKSTEAEIGIDNMAELLGLSDRALV